MSVMALIKCYSFCKFIDERICHRCLSSIASGTVPYTLLMFVEIMSTYMCFPILNRTDPAFGHGDTGSHVWLPRIPLIQCSHT